MQTIQSTQLFNSASDIKSYTTSKYFCCDKNIYQVETNSAKCGITVSVSVKRRYTNHVTSRIQHTRPSPLSGKPKYTLEQATLGPARLVTTSVVTVTSSTNNDYRMQTAGANRELQGGSFFLTRNRSVCHMINI